MECYNFQFDQMNAIVLGGIQLYCYTDPLKSEVWLRGEVVIQALGWGI